MQSREAKPPQGTRFGKSRCVGIAESVAARLRCEKEAKDGDGDGIRGNVRGQWRRARVWASEEQGSQQGLQEEPGPPVPYEFPMSSLVLLFPGFTVFRFTF